MQYSHLLLCLGALTGLAVALPVDGVATPDGIQYPGWKREDGSTDGIQYPGWKREEGSTDTVGYPGWKREDESTDGIQYPGWK